LRQNDSNTGRQVVIDSTKHRNIDGMSDMMASTAHAWKAKHPVLQPAREAKQVGVNVARLLLSSESIEQEGRAPDHHHAAGNEGRTHRTDKTRVGA
jgi:hypothetical protein